MIYILIIAIALFCIWFFIFRKFKLPKLCAINLFTGGVKTGKSGVSLFFAIKTYKRVLRSWSVKCWFINLFNKTIWKKNKRSLPEKPLLYSNIPLANIEYADLTDLHLLRKVRMNYGSVAFIDEASLVADSMLIKDNKVNNELLLFFKLFGHSTRGGVCIINSHCISDLHYAIKRTVSQYFYIHSLSKFPFLSVAKVRECVYSDDGTTINSFNEDLEESVKNVYIWNSIFNYYDCYAYSIFTDKLELKNNLHKYYKFNSLKAEKIVSFRKAFNDLIVADSSKLQDIEKEVITSIEDFKKSLEEKENEKF